MKSYKQLICGILIGSFASALVAFGDEIRTFIAEEASYPVVVDGTPIALDMPVVTIEDRTYLPLRAIGDALGVKVDWNEEMRQAEITKSNTPKPTPDISKPDEVVTVDGVIHYDRIKYETINGEEYIKFDTVEEILSHIKANHAITYYKDNCASYGNIDINVDIYNIPIEMSDINDRDTWYFSKNVTESFFKMINDFNAQNRDRDSLRVSVDFQKGSRL